MNQKLKKTIIIILILACIVAMILVIKKSIYEKGTFTDSTKNCITYSKQCVCLGVLMTEISNPSTYTCNGIELCRNINKEIC